jgi:exonuclease VII large subunit
VRDPFIFPLFAFDSQAPAPSAAAAAAAPSGDDALASSLRDRIRSLEAQLKEKEDRVALLEKDLSTEREQRRAAEQGRKAAEQRAAEAEREAGRLRKEGEKKGAEAEKEKARMEKQVKAAQQEGERIKQVMGGKRSTEGRRLEEGVGEHLLAPAPPQILYSFLCSCDHFILTGTHQHADTLVWFLLV